MMASGEEFRRLALALDGTCEAPHFDRAAFKVARIYATLGPDGRSANLKLTPDEQELKCLLAPDLFRALDNAWGRQGWTSLDVSAASKAEIENALRLAWQHALPKPRQRKASGPKGS